MGGVSMEWKEVDICQLCDSVSETYKGNASEVVLINTSDVLDGKCLNHEYVPNKKLKGQFKKTFRKGDILYSEIRPANKRFCFVDFEPKDYIASTKLMVLRAHEDVDPKYLYQILRGYDTLAQLQMLAESRSGTFPQITYSELSNIMVSLPSQKAQKNIVSILSSLDRKIELNNKINADLEEMAQAIFKNWFVDFEPFKDGKFVDSELGMIPEGWKVGRLTDVIKLMPGGTPKTSEPLYWDNGTIPFFSPKDVNGVYCFATEKHITETGLNKCSSNLYPKDTIFITCRGTVGKVCLAACDMAMNQSNYAIKAIDGYSQYYVFFLVKSVVERLIKKSNGAVFSAITSKDFDEEILIPSQKAVEDFTNVIDGFFRRIFTIGTENSRLSLLRDTLLPRLMSGELEVPE